MGRLEPGHCPIYVLSDLGAINVLDSMLANELTAAVRQRGIDVLFVDTLSRTHQLDESSADMRLVMQAFDRIARDAPVTIVLLHHAGWGESKRGRGSSSIRDALQHEILLTDEGGSVKISLIKAKSAEKCDRLTTMTINKMPGDGLELSFSDAGPPLGRPSEGDKRRSTITRLLEDEPEGMSYTKLRDAVKTLGKCGERTAEREIEGMVSAGSLVKGQDGNYTLA
jgi:hypothetical protein